jgi:hypothetical protein
MNRFTVIDCEQRTPDWYAARVGLMTATDAAAMLSRGKRAGEEAKGKVELRRRLAHESVYGVPLEDDHYESEYMRRGREREEEGRDCYEAVTGEVVQVVGFLRHLTLPIGCSPDGLVGDCEGGLELKCPKWSTHWDYLDGGTLPREYAPQVIHSLFVTGLPFWDFCSYCPEFRGPKRLFWVRVHRDDVDLAAYELAFTFFWKEVEQVQDSLRALSAPELAHA